MSGRAPHASRADPVSPVPSDARGRGRLPWALAARLARRDVRRHPGRTALVAGLLALPLAVVTLWLVALATSLQPAGPDSWLPAGVEAEVRWHGAPVVQLGPELQGIEVVGDAIDGIETWDDVADGLRDVIPGARGWAMTGCEGVYLAATAAWDSVCTYLELGDAPAPLEGRAPRTADEVLVRHGSAAAQDDILEVVVDGEARALTVVGTFAGPELGVTSLRVGADPEAAPPLDSLQMTLVSPAVGWDDVVRLNAAGFTASARAALAEEPEDSRIPYLTQGFPEGDQDAGGGDADAALVGLGVGALILLLLLVVAPSHVVGVRRSARGYALLAATGADARTLRAVVLLGAVLQGVITAATGMGLGLLTVAVIDLLAPSVFGGHDLGVVVPWLWLAGVAVFAVATVLGAALLPARTAARIDVLRVLAGRRGDAHPSRRLSVAGVALTCGGGALGAWAALRAEPALVVAALVALVAGLLLCAGTLVGLAARVLAPWVSLPARLALRDADRHRARSIAAVTAVAAAAATLIGVGLLSESSEAHGRAAQLYDAGDGAVVTSLGHEAADGGAVLGAVADAARAADPGANVSTIMVPAVRLPGIPEPVPIAGTGEIDLRVSPDAACPVYLPGAAVDDAERSRLEREDPRCAPRADRGSGWTTRTFADDGAWLADVGLPGTADAAAALAAGRAVVADERLIHADGTVRARYLAADLFDEDGTLVEDVAYVSFPAVAVAALDRTAFEVVLPTSALTALGLEPRPGGVVALASGEATRAGLRAAMASASQGVAWTFVVDNGRSTRTVRGAILTASALVLGVGTAGLVLLLVAGEARADLAVLAAVGASPRMRRRLAGAQAGVLVAIGTALGTVMGFVVAVGFVALSARRGGSVDPAWALVVPWGWVALVVAVLPLGAWATGWLTTRSRMPAPNTVR